MLACQEEILQLTPVELHWMEVALSGQLEKENAILRLLEQTWHLADDLQYHGQQLLAQREITAGYSQLVAKIKKQLIFLRLPEEELYEGGHA